MEPFELLDHEADIGIRGWGKTVEEAFENGARAMFSIMVNLEDVDVEKEIIINANAEDLESLFVEWLNELLAQRDISGMVFNDFTVRISSQDEELTLEGWARGERLDPEKHEIRTEVKAATYCGLAHGKEKKGNFVQCVLDI